MQGLLFDAHRHLSLSSSPTSRARRTIMATRWPKPKPKPKPKPHCFPSPIAGVALLTFLLAVLLHTPFTTAQEPPPPWLLCDPYPPSGNYTENSTYQGNINRLSGTLPKNVSSSPVLYATDSVGTVPDIVYALALCRGDANASSCESCVATAFRGAQKGCPLFKDVLIFYDLCQLRFSNRNFFPDSDNFVTAYYLVGSQVVSRPTTGAFDAAVSLLVNATAGYAAENSSRIYALAQCTPDKTVDFCQSCFGPIINQLPQLFSGVNGGGVFGTWCSFRYEVYPFFSGRPLLQLPVFVGTPAPAPAPASAPANGSQEKSVSKAGKVILAILMPAIAAMLAITVICFWTRRRRSAAQSFQPCKVLFSSDKYLEFVL